MKLYLSNWRTRIKYYWNKVSQFLSDKFGILMIFIVGLMIGVFVWTIGIKFWKYLFAHFCLWMAVHYIWFLGLVWVSRYKGIQKKAEFNFYNYGIVSFVMALFSSLGVYLIWG